MPASQQEAPRPPPRHERATPPSALVQGRPERVYILIDRCEELVRDLYNTGFHAWDTFFTKYGMWYQRVHFHIHDRRQDIPQDVKTVLIKRLQILEAELKVAYSLVTSIHSLPKVMMKDMQNIEATFWPPHRIDMPGDPLAEFIVDDEVLEMLLRLP
ncbi:hypothetical protein TMatcc_008580 [Talaromyces marneffei ATCC 18224]|uniref:Uncharacterized protein n=2 Tax=Talaromyces marneffei TaxID=37727 RepID=B6QLL8_TALMQ|nr:uncharacterized protein EYB26_007911 [Talaromyces marneffei]EEA21995.1 hypothetical protein PMAA_057780 [Talaromyces marneffei ATCC 18224]KAE8550540.1 hypothetical protein EYB25_006768 [Talaromyces marneffei]QGA20209.1 hypothetical protein EYB26_007911 [Talaromyces marneffei]